ncbi:hypothetical protein [Weissella confusa]|uniref:hypothetical protein n=2 Tax=Weissella confusa TaxID=1583 RepID=UPI000310FE28|nr:hypothetical protein [Weissella confusa]MBJ7616440.1 hypothetical protein [Weissella confusa]MBJ7672839.1 hypothetical protein [Weissella confusa]MBJ7691376.1 hypothetical protein [Weissella confusa]MBJ7701573.1 hypothetical protein [Weissella confusa]WEY48012.1 hypothetical protein P3T51_10815 [Weissella confusa]
MMFGKTKKVEQPANSKQMYYKQLAHHVKRAWDMQVAISQIAAQSNDALTPQSLYVSVQQPNAKQQNGVTPFTMYVEAEDMVPLLEKKLNDQLSVADEYLESLELSDSLTNHDQTLVSELRELQQAGKLADMLKTLLNHNVVTRHDLH